MSFTRRMWASRAKTHSQHVTGLVRTTGWIVERFFADVVGWSPWGGTEQSLKVAVLGRLVGFRLRVSGS